MKKLLFLLIGLICFFALTGCEKAVTTKMKATLSEETNEGKKITTTLEVVFTNDVVSSVKETRAFGDKKVAEQYYDLIKSLDSKNSNIKITKSGNRVTEEYQKVNSTYKYYGMSKMGLTSTLENSGWKVE